MVQSPYTEKKGTNVEQIFFKTLNEYSQRTTHFTNLSTEARSNNVTAAYANIK